jgi:hypothetical protein
LAPRLRLQRFEQGYFERRSTLHRKIVINGESKDVQHHGQPNGLYANHFKVGHNAFEFVLDFGQNYTQARPAPLHTRIITTPVYAKSLLGLLQESIDQYEQLFGAIPDGDNEGSAC